MHDPDSDHSDLDMFRTMIRDIYSSRSRHEKEDKIGELIDYLKSVRIKPEQLKSPDIDQDISKLVTSIKKLERSKVEKLMTQLKLILPHNREIKLLYSATIYEQSSPDDFIDYVYNDRDFCDDHETLSKILSSYGNVTDPSRPVIFFSLCGKFDPKVFTRYLDGPLADDINSAVIKNFQDNGKYGELSKFLEALIKKEPSITYTVELINAYQKSGELGKMSKVIGQLNYDEIDDVDSFVILIRKSIASGNHSLASEIARHALLEYPENHQLLSELGEALYRAKNMEGAKDVFTDIHTLFKDDYDAVRRLIDITEELQDLEGMIGWIAVLCSQLICSKDEMLKKVRAEIELSKFDEAFRDINEQNTPVKDVDFCRLLLTLNLKLGRVTEALNTAEDILKVIPDDEQATTFILDDLFGKYDYEGFLNRISEVPSESIKEEFTDKIAAALLYTEEFDSAMNMIIESPSIAQSDYFINALYSLIHRDKEIHELTETLKKANVESPLIDMVIDNIRGKKVRVLDSLPDTVNEFSPVSIVAIVTFDNLDTSTEVVPDVIRKLISIPKYKEIQIIVDTISEINSSKISKDILVFPHFRFPVIMALIRKGYLDRAKEQLLLLVDTKSRDPFYDYVEALILSKQMDIAQSQRSLSRATSILSNVDFFNLEIALALSGKHEKAALNSIDMILAIDCGDFIDFEQIYSYVKETRSNEFREKVLGAVSTVSIENSWLFRLMRDREIELGNFESGEAYSKKVISARNVLDSDVSIHIDLLKKLGIEDSVIEFMLEQEKKTGSGSLDVMIGNWYYEKEDYGDALAFFKRAISRGVDQASIINYIETLIETKNFDEARKLIGVTGSRGMAQLKLYYKAGEIQKIIDLLKNIKVETRDDEERIAYVSRVLWINKEVRDILIGIYEQEGFLFLGKIISDRLLESNEYEKAIEIMKNIQKNYPDNIENLRKLSQAYERTGKFHDAINVLQQAMKITRNKDSMVGLVDGLLRVYYDQKLFSDIKKFYESNKEWIDSTNIHFIVRSYLRLGDYDSAESIVGKYHGSVVSNEAFQEFTDEINQEKRTREILGYADRMLRLEYKTGRRFSTEDAVSSADIPLEIVEDVFSFLSSEQGYSEINDQKYEILSRDVIQRVCRKTRVANVSDLSISVIYNNMDRKDVVIAKNIYAYIQKEISRVRKPRIEDQDLQKLLKIALKEDVDHDPYKVACKLNAGISEAMEVIALMGYVSSVNAGGKSGHV